MHQIFIFRNQDAEYDTCMMIFIFESRFCRNNHHKNFRKISWIFVASVPVNVYEFVFSFSEGVSASLGQVSGRN